MLLGKGERGRRTEMWLPDVWGALYRCHFRKGKKVGGGIELPATHSGKKRKHLNALVISSSADLF